MDVNKETQVHVSSWVRDFACKSWADTSLADDVLVSSAHGHPRSLLQTSEIAELQVDALSLQTNIFNSGLPFPQMVAQSYAQP